MRKALHILLLVLAVAVSCRGPRRIPRSTMADIYYDMFLVDAQVRDDPDLHSRADTMLIYEAVFNRYGYNTDDYLYSIRYYLKDPERFAKTVHTVTERLQKEIAGLDAIIEHESWEEKYLKAERPSLDTLLAMFLADSTYWGTLRIVPDSSAYGGLFRFISPEMDSLSRVADSLSAKKDSLAVKKDSLSVKRDTLALPDGSRFDVRKLSPSAADHRTRPPHLPVRPRRIEQGTSGVQTERMDVEVMEAREEEAAAER